MPKSYIAFLNYMRYKNVRDRVRVAQSPLTPRNSGGTGKAPLSKGGWGDQALVPQQTEKCYIKLSNNLNLVSPPRLPL